MTSAPLRPMASRRLERRLAAASVNLRCTSAVTRISRVREVVLTLIVDRHSEKVMAKSEAAERIDPGVARKVRDHADEAASLAHGSDSVECAPEVGGTAPFRRWRRRDCRQDGADLVFS